MFSFQIPSYHCRYRPSIHVKAFYKGIFMSIFLPLLRKILILSFSIFLLKGQYKKAISSLHHLAALQGSHSPQQITGQGSLENQRALIQLATCHFALGEYRVCTAFHPLVFHYLTVWFPFVSLLRIFPSSCFQQGIKHNPGSTKKNMLHRENNCSSCLI